MTASRLRLFHSPCGSVSVVISPGEVLGEVVGVVGQTYTSAFTGRFAVFQGRLRRSSSIKPCPSATIADVWYAANARSDRSGLWTSTFSGFLIWTGSLRSPFSSFSVERGLGRSPGEAWVVAVVAHLRAGTSPNYGAICPSEPRLASSSASAVAARSSTPRCRLSLML